MVFGGIDDYTVGRWKIGSSIVGAFCCAEGLRNIQGH